jgi:hypothetical protein
MAVLYAGQRNLVPLSAGFQISWSNFSPKKLVQSVFDTFGILLRLLLPSLPPGLSVTEKRLALLYHSMAES